MYPSNELLLELKKIINIPDNVIDLSITLGVNDFPTMDICTEIDKRTVSQPFNESPSQVENSFYIVPRGSVVDDNLRELCKRLVDCPVPNEYTGELMNVIKGITIYMEALEMLDRVR